MILFGGRKKHFQRHARTLALLCAAYMIPLLLQCHSSYFTILSDRYKALSYQHPSILLQNRSMCSVPRPSSPDKRVRMTLCMDCSNSCPGWCGINTTFSRPRAMHSSKWDDTSPSRKVSNSSSLQDNSNVRVRRELGSVGRRGR